MRVYYFSFFARNVNKYCFLIDKLKINKLVKVIGYFFFFTTKKNIIENWFNNLEQIKIIKILKKVFQIQKCNKFKCIPFSLSLSFMFLQMATTKYICNLDNLFSIK